MSGPSGGSRTYKLDPTTSGGVSVPRLLFAFLRQRFTGTVEIGQRSPAGARCVWVRGGMPVFCDWISDDLRLGDMLVRSGRLQPAALERALAALAAGEGLMGAILIAQGQLDAAGRSQALRRQCTAKLMELFAEGATLGEAKVTAMDHDKGKDDELAQVNVLGLIAAGVAAHYDRTRIEAEIGAALHGDLVASPALPRYERQFGFEPSDAAVLQGLSRGTTVNRLRIPGVASERALQIVYTLWVSQMLRTGDDAVQAIAKGATAASAAQQVGVTIGDQGGKPKPATSKPKPPPAPKPTSKPSTAKPPPAPKPKPEAKPAPEAPESGGEEFVSQLETLEAKVDAEANAFELFALELDAGRKEIRASWAELSKTFHPDALEGLGLAHLRPRVEMVFAALSEAYGVLSNKDERAKLRQALELGGTKLKANEDASAVVRNAFEAEMIARDADKLLKARQYERARELYERAHELSPQDSDIEAALYYARFRSGAGESDDARATIAALDKVVEDQPICARAYYFKGLLELGLEELNAAKTSFTKASTLDKRNIDAQRQLRAIQMRQRGPAKARAKAEKNKAKPSALDGLRGLFKKS